MRLTLVIPSLNPGGAERVLSVLANHWVAQGHAVTVVTYDDQGEPPFYDLDSRVVHRALRLGGARGILRGMWNLSRRVRVLRREILASKPDAVLSFMETTNVLALLAMLGTGIPVTVAERTDPHRYRPGRLWDVLRRLLYGRAHAIVTQTERAAEFFRPRWNDRLHVIPNPVPPPPAPDSLDPRLPVSGPAIVSVGKLVHLKGYDVLVTAFAKVAPRYPDWNLVIYGAGDQLNTLSEWAAALGVGERVHFPGVTRTPYAVMRQAGVFVLSSRFEGFPNTLCEAMACGLPVIATDCPSGPREIVTDGVDGLLVPNEDATALAEALERLMSDPELRVRLGRAAEKITERFSVDSVGERWVRVMSYESGVVSGELGVGAEPIQGEDS